MHGRNHLLGESRQSYWLAAVAGDAKGRTEQSLCGRRAEQNENPRLDGCELCVEPLAARGELAAVRLIVDAGFAPSPPLEVLDGVGDVDAVTIDAGRSERLVEYATRRPNEGAAGDVLMVAGLLADQHQLGVGGSFAEHRLRRIPPETAVAAACSCTGHAT